MAETVRKNLGMVTAYAYAVSKGYSGTEEEFAELMASYADVAQDAETSAQAAAQSATTAEQKATQAAGSATNAAVSATSASESAQAAEGSSNSASLYAQNASASATNAAGSASSASTYAGNASASAQAAEGSANDAQTSATQAAGSVTTATAKAGEAATSATTAVEAAQRAEGAAATLVIDDTLTHAGQAADAKKTGDEIGELKENLTESVGDLKADLSSLYAYRLKDWSIPNATMTIGTLDLSGQIVSDSTRIVSVTYLKYEKPICLDCKGTVVLCIYDNSYALTSRLTLSNTAFIVPANTYFRYAIVTAGTVTNPYNVDVLSRVLVCDIDKSAINLKINNQINSNNIGKMYLLGAFVHGNINVNGSFEYDQTRITSADFIEFDEDVKLIFDADDTKIVVCIYNSSYVMTRRTLYSSGSVIIPKNTLFRIVILGVGVTSISDVDAFKKRVMIANPLAERVSVCESQLVNVLTYDFLRCFHKLTGVGDSLMAGFTSIGADTVNSATAKAAGNNWFDYLCTRLNRTGTNLAIGSSTIHNWRYADRAGIETDISNANIPTDCYMVGLGVNDMGQSLPIGSSADIDTSNIDNCADTVYGNLYYILSKLKSYNPYAKIFVFTIPKYGTDNVTPINTAISAVCAMLSNVYCIQLPTVLFDVNFLNSNFTNGHYNPIAYNYISQIIESEINNYIFSNYSEFVWIPYEH